VSHLVDSYGYYAIVVIVSLEAFGIPIPGETILIAAGAYAGSTHHLSVWLIWLLAFLSVEVGATASYLLGDKGGFKLARRYGRYIHVNEKELKMGRYVFDRYGVLVVSLGRFVAVLRTYAGFLAGTLKMPVVKFQLANALGALTWTGLWSILSYKLGDSLSKASSTADYIVGAVAVALVIVLIFVVRARAKIIEAKAEAAYPGPLEP
jgi:membrane protein DedA with SNARE-associated domain